VSHYPVSNLNGFSSWPNIFWKCEFYTLLTVRLNIFLLDPAKGILLCSFAGSQRLPFTMRVRYRCKKLSHTLPRKSLSICMPPPRSKLASIPSVARGDFPVSPFPLFYDVYHFNISPELVQDNSRDFSVYVLDPLESQSAPALVNIPQTSPSSKHGTTHSSTSVQQPRGVAVGMGLMSWALLADEQDSITVNGTILEFGTPQEALEVIFALREVRQNMIQISLVHRILKCFCVKSDGSNAKGRFTSRR
jgi:hypothetical protein